MGSPKPVDSLWSRYPLNLDPAEFGMRPVPLGFRIPDPREDLESRSLKADLIKYPLVVRVPN